jgi:hypothetical protein
MINIIFVVCFFLCCTLINAQSQKYFIGSEYGLGIASLYGKKKSSNELQFTESSILGYNIGLIVNRRIKKNIYLKTGVIYEGKGNSVFTSAVNYGTGALDTFQIKNRISGMTIPIILRLGNAEGIGYFIEAGGYFSMIQNNQYPIIEEANNSYLNYYPNYIHVNNKRLDWGVLLGLGRTFHLAEDLMISLELRDAIGITNLTQTNRTLERRRTNILSFVIEFVYILNKCNKYTGEK